MKSRKHRFKYPLINVVSVRKLGFTLKVVMGKKSEGKTAETSAAARYSALFYQEADKRGRTVWAFHFDRVEGVLPSVNDMLLTMGKKNVEDMNITQQNFREFIERGVELGRLSADNYKNYLG